MEKAGLRNPNNVAKFQSVFHDLKPHKYAYFTGEAIWRAQRANKNEQGQLLAIQYLSHFAQFVTSQNASTLSHHLKYYPFYSALSRTDIPHRTGMFSSL